MTTSSPKHTALQQNYLWHRDNLLAATKAVGGYWLEQPQNKARLEQLQAERIVTDTRRIDNGDVFLAIVGDNFDGHDFIEAAANSGAVAVIVNRPVSTQTDIPQLIVSDTRLAFGQLAAYQRHAMTNLKVIAITGSSGKTTCKEMLGSIFNHASDLSRQSQTASTLITKGNLNNDLGVPMTLLELTHDHHYAVLELGANHVGEIAYTTQLVQPDVACVLNVGTAHLGEFGGRDAIASTKAEIYQSLSAQDIAIVPLDDEYADLLIQTAKQQSTHLIGFGWQYTVSTDHLDTYAKHCEQTVYASAVQVQPTHNEFVLHIGKAAVPIYLPLAGEHNVSNALAAAACAHALGLDINEIASGLRQVQAAKGRLARQPFGIHTLIDDTYNANPHSVRAAAEVLGAQQGYKIMVLGDIAELGDSALAEHQQLGVAIAQQPIDTLLCVGSLASMTAQTAYATGLKDAHAFADKAQLFEHLKTKLDTLQQQTQPSTVLFKGSRSMTMETLIAQLVETSVTDAMPSDTDAALILAKQDKE